MKEEGLSEDQKQEKRQQHAQKETEFLRLKRSRLGVEDFEALKVIGRGAFGEVSSVCHVFVLCSSSGVWGKCWWRLPL